MLYYASGPVLGAFLLGTLAPSATEAATFVGMLAGLGIMTLVWAQTNVAFTWYIFIGASATMAAAWLADAMPRRARPAHDAV